MSPIEELELLAKWRGYIEGHALDMSQPKRSGLPGERALSEESHRELVVALSALRALRALQESSLKGAQQASLLEQHFVLRGEAARAKEKKQILIKYERRGLCKELLQREQKRALQEALEAYLLHRS